LIITNKYLSDVSDYAYLALRAGLWLLSNLILNGCLIRIEFSIKINLNYQKQPDFVFDKKKRN
jgi:hypothetical protein